MKKPAILIARAIFPETLAHLSQHFEVDSNQGDEVLSASDLSKRLQGKVGVLTTGSERIDGALLQAAERCGLVAIDLRE